MRKLNILWIIVSLCCACDDFLSKTQPDELTPESTQSFSEMLLEEGYIPDTEAIDKMLQYMDDDVENRLTTSTSGYTAAHIRNKLFYTWQPDAVNQIIDETGVSSYSIKGWVPWKSYYKYILGCNLILKYADNSVGIDEDKDYLKGQAYVLRAYYYFQLINTYAWPYNDTKHKPEESLGVPIITKPEIGELAFPRNTVAEVYDLIVSDIETGIALLDKEKREVTKFRIMHLSAHAIASRIYLYMEEWDKALEHARYVMERREIADFTGFSDTDYSTKYLFRLDNDELLWVFGYRTNWWEATSTYAASSAFTPSSDLFKKYDVEGLTDKRKTYFFNTKATDKLTSVTKYSLSLSISKNQGIRVTEVYLNGIEALLEKYIKGDASAGAEAIRLLNDFRVKRYILAGEVSTDVTTTDANELMEIYRLERRKELCFEGQRWFDLRRYGMPQMERLWHVDGNTTEKYVLEEGDPMYVLEIPTYLMDLNPGLVPNESLPSPRLPEIL
ncbi:RagB/SusD family nutrient uptake outer membrane protein [uncultured Butyricimonas sp.]|uniref:RagB/SusD family nutrient uptake outer membrane protein n=1 Tax=uncultured Butyricimonas sp. TaxID=1268785 RepID=UPI0026DB0580|nr:RagB/SusD family nutrient uptake outer membrane protein [uncultured Butyricimonas sp.]